MPKTITLGNGSLLICLDKFGQVKDFFYHYAGLENHVGESMTHKIGVFIDERFSWIDDGSWKIEIGNESGTMASSILASNSKFGIEIHFEDIIYNEKNIFIRKVKVKNSFDRARKLKLFFNQQFNIAQTLRGDTAYYDPHDHVLIHYEGRRVFLINTLKDGKGFDDYSVGIIGIEGKEGTFKDAEDGELSRSAIEHGETDSVLGINLEIKSKEEITFHYWITVAKSIETAKKLNNDVLKRGPDYIIKSTKDYWSAWIHNQNFSFYGLNKEIEDLFNDSLVAIRTHVSKNGSIIASGDSSMLQYGKDTYSYMWPRDAAISAVALAKAGDFNASRRFFEFCNDVISPEGYFMHKYRPDKALGSSWHPWVKDGKPELPIQEDETALVICALWNHFELSRDLEFIEDIYNSMIRRASDFMVSYRDRKTGLPRPSYDLWEMKFGTNTFTASSVYGALVAAGKFANLLGKDESAKKYENAAQEIKSGIIKHLFNQDNKTFHKLVNFVNGKPVYDSTIDISSVYGLYKFGVLKHDDPVLKKAFEVALERLTVKTEVGGIARFEGDVYHGFGGNIPGNPWFITTLWMTQYNIEFLKKESDAADIVSQLMWPVKWALPSGILSEQLNPYNGQQISAAPLTWSHAEYVITVIKYLEKLEGFGICKVCDP